MSSFEYLRKIISERLAAAAVEIFTEFEKTIVQYKEEIDRQRKLLDITRKPEVKLHTTDFPQQYIFKEEVVLVDQNVCYKERNSSQDKPTPPHIIEEHEELEPPQMKIEQGKPEPPEIKGEPESPLIIEEPEEPETPQIIEVHEELEPTQMKIEQVKLEPPEIKEEPESPQIIEVHEESEPPQLKEEQEELCTSHEEEQHETNQLQLKLDPDSFMETSSSEDIHLGELVSTTDQLCFNCSSEDDWSNGEKSQLDDSGSATNVEQSSPSESTSNTDGGINVLCRNDQRILAVDSSALKTLVTMPDGEGKPDCYDSRTLHTAENPYSCKVCGKSVRDSWTLRVHMRSHTGEKPYSCKVCGKGFRYRHSWTTHLRTHTGEKPYPCQACGKSFNSSSTLKVHKRSHSDEKSFSCKICGKSFKQSSGLNYHVNTHNDKKPFSCEVCGKGFTKALNLTDHMRTHTGEKPFSCEVCGKSYSGSKSLAHHVKAYTCKEPLFCKICGKSFNQNCGLITHMRSHRLNLV